MAKMDASWEREANAFGELLERHNNCDVALCVCPQGRLFSTNSGKYELLLCGWCGAYGSHRECHGLVWRGIYLVCWDCSEIIDRADKKDLDQRGNHPIVDVGRQQTALPIHRSRTRPQSRTSSLLQQELDQQSPTTSAWGRPNGSSMEQTVQQIQSSQKPIRKRQCSKSLRGQSAAGRKQKQSNAYSILRTSSGCHLQQPEIGCPSHCKDSFKKEQALKD